MWPSAMWRDCASLPPTTAERCSGHCGTPDFPAAGRRMVANAASTHPGGRGFTAFIVRLWVRPRVHKPCEPIGETEIVLIFQLAGELGFEPRLTESESVSHALFART